jgi:NAD(P)-dependent dehydrogenase (short-subunit alcohol dehydrogenase family)
MNPFDLSGKTAIVTGSSRGIGRSIAEHLARAGANVVVSSRNPEPCQAVAESIQKQGGTAAAIACNVARKADCERLIEESRLRFGSIDILVCNAAANPYYGPLVDIPDDAYHKTMDTNVLSTIWLSRLVKPDMAARGGGSIILISSVGALRASPNLGAYAISKAADVQMTRTLAAELGSHKIRVNCILPGLVKTDFSRVLWDNPQAEKLAASSFPLGRLGESDDIGPAAVYFASSASQWTTGQTLVIDGGATIVQASARE